MPMQRYAPADQEPDVVPVQEPPKPGEHRPMIAG